MKAKLFFILVAIFALNSCSEKHSIEDLKKLAATESYPEDTYLDTVTNKRALIIVAHDDDDCAMAGTIYKLKKAGWKIEQWSFTTTPLEKGTTAHPTEIICEGHRLILEDGHYRNKNPYDSTLAQYMPIPKNYFDTIFETKKVSNKLISKINDYKPNVIFTLDNVIGGYGNPDHIFLNQLILDLFQAHKISVQCIYQVVYTDNMETEINDKLVSKRIKKWGFENPFVLAKKLYGVSGAPEPDVEINIQDYANGKMEYLLSYSEVAKKNMRKFIPYYEEFDAKTYFGVFNREFFKVYEIKPNY